MPNFALLLPHAPDRYQGLSEDEYMDIIKDYVAWVEELTAKGIYQDGHKLTDDPGKTLSSANGGIEVHDSPATEIAEILGGLMIVRAADFPAAVEIARTCPHLKHNQTLHVRRDIDAMEEG